MKIRLITAVAAALSFGVAGLAVAQTETSPAADATATQNPAMKSPNDVTGAPLAKGHNSFTKAEAAARIRKAGYSQVVVSGLDADGLWRATATQNGQTVNVALDYKGNVGPR